MNPRAFVSASCATLLSPFVLLCIPLVSALLSNGFAAAVLPPLFFLHHPSTTLVNPQCWWVGGHPTMEVLASMRTPQKGKHAIVERSHSWAMFFVCKRKPVRLGPSIDDTSIFWSLSLETTVGPSTLGFGADTC